MTTATALRFNVAVEQIEVSAYQIPTDQPESDGTLQWDSTTLVLVEARAGGQHGLGYTYADAAAARLIEGKLVEQLAGWVEAGIPQVKMKIGRHSADDLDRVRAAPLCDAASIPLSAHTAPSLHRHPCCALEAVCNVEYFHDHVRIEQKTVRLTPTCRGPGWAWSGRPRTPDVMQSRRRRAIPKAVRPLGDRDVRVMEWLDGPHQCLERFGREERGW